MKNMVQIQSINQLINKEGRKEGKRPQPKI